MKDIHAVARLAVAFIVDEIRDRCGLDSAWDEIDADIQEEIREAMAEHIVTAFNHSPERLPDSAPEERA